MSLLPRRPPCHEVHPIDTFYIPPLTSRQAYCQEGQQSQQRIPDNIVEIQGVMYPPTFPPMLLLFKPSFSSVVRVLPSLVGAGVHDTVQGHADIGQN